MHVVNNTFHNIDGIGVVKNQSADFSRVFNNIFSGVSTGIYFEAGSTSTNDYNNFWNVTVAHAGDASAGPNDLALDPVFVDTNTFDFTIQQFGLMDSAADSFNGVSAPTYDYNGNPRPAGEIAFGAVEVAVPPAGTMIIVD
jgi:hypothetical protein